MPESTLRDSERRKVKLGNPCKLRNVGPYIYIHMYISGSFGDYIHSMYEEILEDLLLSHVSPIVVLDF